MPAVLTPRSESRARQYAPSTADEANRQSNTEEEEEAADSATFHPRGGDATTNNKITPESSASVMSSTVSVTMDKASIKAVPDERSVVERFADNVKVRVVKGFAWPTEHEGKAPAASGLVASLGGVASE